MRFYVFKFDNYQEYNLNLITFKLIQKERRFLNNSALLCVSRNRLNLDTRYEGIVERISEHVRLDIQQVFDSRGAKKYFE